MSYKESNKIHFFICVYSKTSHVSNGYTAHHQAFTRYCICNCLYICWYINMIRTRMICTSSWYVSMIVQAAEISTWYVQAADISAWFVQAADISAWYVQAVAYTVMRELLMMNGVSVRNLWSKVLEWIHMKRCVLLDSLYN